MSTALHALPDALLAFDTNQQIIFANASATRYLLQHELPLNGDTGVCATPSIFSMGRRKSCSHPEDWPWRALCMANISIRSNTW